MNPKDPEIVVVGAGPAGCFFALEAAQRGAHVTIIEKKNRTNLGHKRPDDVERSVFQRLGMDIPAVTEWSHSPSNTVAIPPDLSGRRDLGSADVIPLAMDRFITRLVAKAQSQGVKLIDSATVQALTFIDGTADSLVYERAGQHYTIMAPLYVDASGMSGVLRKQPGFLGQHHDGMTNHDICTAYRGKIFPPAAKLEEYANRHQYRDRINYSLLASRGSYSVENIMVNMAENWLDILIGFKKSWGGTARQEVQAYLDREGFVGEKIIGAGGFIPIRQSLDVLVNDHLMIIGNAACQVISAIGSGVASSMLAAQLAAKTAVHALRIGKTDRATLWSYNCEYQRGRGALMAYFYGSQLATEAVLPHDAAWLIMSGMVTPSDFQNINNAQLINPFSGLLSRLFAFSQRPMFCIQFLKHAGLANKLMKIYQQYPAQPHPRKLGQWQTKRDALLTQFHRPDQALRGGHPTRA